MGDYAARDLVKIPGLLSLARLPLAAVFPLTVGHPAWSVAVLAVAAATDLADGWYARRFHQVTPTGALLDGATDKVFVLGVAVTLLASGSLSVTETLLLGTRDLGEIAIALYWFAARRPRPRGVPHSANRLGKLATVMQFSTVVAVIIGTAHHGPWILASAACGLLAAIGYAARELRGSP